ncbi:MAG: glycosyltransferase family 4 protein [Actinomycetota bacterium]|nr:glycosyltransferase family 4 protein [Actinomycetota bacterium]
MTGQRMPRVLFVGRGRFRFPLGRGLERRFEALSGELDWRQLGTAADGKPSADPRLVLGRPFPLRLLDGPLYYLRLPRRIARELRRFEPDAVIAQGAQETAIALLGRRLAGSKTAVILDLHGDWRAPTRLYGSRARRVLDPLSDALARSALRRADGVRTISTYTTELVRAEGIEPAAEFPAFMDLEPFLANPVVPLPEAPRVLFVGVLERYKAFDVLADAWRRVVVSVPEAELHVVGQGALAPVAESLVEELPGRVEWSPSLTAEEVTAALDASTLLVLPSRSEGMGRVVIEAGCRGRAVVGSRVGGIPDVVADGESGLLVPPGDAGALAGALIRVLSDRRLAERLGAEARIQIERWLATPEEYARRVRDLVGKVVTSGTIA